MAERLIVIGGGVIGLSCALECSRRGYSVTVLEAGTCGGQASNAAAGMIAPFSENTVAPDAFYDLCVESWRLFPEWVRFVSETAGRSIEYTVCGSLYAVYHEADIQALETRMMWQAKDAGPLELVSGDRLWKQEPALSRNIVAALYFPEESHVDAPAYVAALADVCRVSGVEVVEQTGHVRLADKSTASPIIVVDRHGQSYEGDRLLISTGAWSASWAETLGLRIPIYPIRGQICAYEFTEVKPEHLIFTSQGYFVQKAHGRLIQGASEDHAGFDAEVTEAGVGRLIRWGPKALPGLHGQQPVRAWAGLRPATQDGWPLLGTVPDREQIVIAAGHYRNGILLSPVTAQIVAGLLDNTEVPLGLNALSHFAPERFTVRGKREKRIAAR